MKPGLIKANTENDISCYDIKNNENAQFGALLDLFFQFPLTHCICGFKMEIANIDTNYIQNTLCKQSADENNRNRIF